VGIARKFAIYKILPNFPPDLNNISEMVLFIINASALKKEEKFNILICPFSCHFYA